MNRDEHMHPVHAPTRKYENRLQTCSQKDRFESGEGKGRGEVTNLVGERGQLDYPRSQTLMVMNASEGLFQQHMLASGPRLAEKTVVCGPCRAF